MVIRTGAQHLVERLRHHSIETLPALPGYQNDQHFNALHDAQGMPNGIRVLHTRQKLGARESEPAALAAEITAVLDRDGQTLIEVPVGEMSALWRYIFMEQERGTRRATT